MRLRGAGLTSRIALTVSMWRCFVQGECSKAYCLALARVMGLDALLRYLAIHVPVPIPISHAMARVVR
jgi:hypothetical protein